MDANPYQVIVNGNLAEGFQLSDVQIQVARLFKTTPEKVAPLFTGQRVIVKKGLDATTARKYQHALNAAGLIAEVDNGETAPAKSSPVAQASLAAAGETLDQRPAPPAPDIDTSDLAMAAAGEDIGKPRTVEPPAIDTSAIALAERGSDLTNNAPPPPPRIDTSALSLGKLGEDVMKYPPPPKPRFDLSAMSIAPLGSDIGEKDDTPPAPIPDTSHITLE